LTTKGTWEIGEIYFPFTEAFKISLENIKKRFVRAAITTAAVVLGIAFLNSLMFMSAITRIALPESQAQAQAYQLWLLFISLLVCAVGITNSMLIAVAERYKEIGTMKTLGALDRHILIMFLNESIIIGGLGGILGYIFGLIAAIVYGIATLGVGFGEIGLALSQPAELLPFLSTLPSAVSLFILSLIISIFLSMAATLYPAYYAAKLNPAEALRYEV